MEGNGVDTPIKKPFNHSLSIIEWKRKWPRRVNPRYLFFLSLSSVFYSNEKFFNIRRCQQTDLPMGTGCELKIHKTFRSEDVLDVTHSGWCIHTGPDHLCWSAWSSCK